MRTSIGIFVLLSSLITSAASAQSGGGTAVSTPPDARAHDTTGTIAVAPPGTVWTSLPAAQFHDSASVMVGRFVETYGSVSSLLLLSRTNSFNNSGWLRDSDGHELATLLFDQLGDAYLGWMRHNKCNNPACDYAYVRGQIVLDHRNPVLRVYEISFESKTGPTSSVVTVAPASGPTKPLLPSQTVPVAYNTTRVPASDTLPQKGLLGRLVKAGVLVIKENPKHAGSAGMFRFGSESLAKTYYRNVRDTELNHLFDDSQWNLGNNQWPRVALVIEEAPAHSRGLDYGNPSAENEDACWRIRARIWTGPGTSIDVAPFNWCLSEAKLGTGFADVELWGGTPKTLIPVKTGAQRTMGPNPPSLPAPDHFFSLSRNEQVMLGSIMVDMGFSYGANDGRAWVLRDQEPAASTLSR